jgi:hypothetical protein
MKFPNKELQQKSLAAHQAANYLMDHRYRHDPELFKAIQTIDTALTNGLTFDDFGQGNNFKLTEIGYEIVLSEIKDRALQTACLFPFDVNIHPSYVVKFNEQREKPSSRMEKKETFFYVALETGFISAKEIIEEQIDRQTQTELRQAVDYLQQNYARIDPLLFPKINLIERALNNGGWGCNDLKIDEEMFQLIKTQVKENVLHLSCLSFCDSCLNEAEEDFIQQALKHRFIKEGEKEEACITYAVALEAKQLKRNLSKIAAKPLQRRLIEEGALTGFARCLVYL